MRWIPVAVWWVCWSAAGLAAIAVPDRDRLFTLSGAHGPGVLDVAGILALLIGAIGPWIYLWRGRAALRAELRGPNPPATGWLIFGVGLGVGLLLASVFSDFSAWWAVGAGVLFGVQLTAFITIARHRATA